MLSDWTGLQLFTLPRHAGGQAKSDRVADSAHGERQRLDAAVIGPGVVVLAIDEGALVVSCPWPKWSKSNSKVQYSWSSKKKLAGSDGEKAGEASEPSPGGRFPRCPLAGVGHRRAFFRRHAVVLLCGWDVAAPRGRRKPSGARESPLFGRGYYNQDIFKDPKKRHDHLSVLYNKDMYGYDSRKCADTPNLQSLCAHQ